jgi:hypothetical protein
MQLKTKTLIAAVVAAFAAQGALAAEPAKKKAAPPECLDAAQAPKASSEKSRADVKAGAKAGSLECEASPAQAAKSEKDRATVKKEVKEAVKSGELSKSDALEKQKK